MKSKSYQQLKEHLLEIGIDPIVLAHLDTLAPTTQKDITLLFKEVVNDELLFVLALRDFDFVANYIQSKEKSKLLQ